MEHMNLRAGRFIPRVDTDAETRIRALEDHLAALSAEWEYILAEMEATLRLLESTMAAMQAVSASDDEPSDTILT